MPRGGTEEEEVWRMFDSIQFRIFF